MHKYNSLFFSVLLFLAACGDGKPKGIIEPKIMVKLLTELHIIDGSLYSTNQMPDSLYYYGTAKYKALFKRYDIDSSRFDKSFKYYSAHPQALKDIYDQVITNLQFKIDSINGVKKPKIKNAAPRK